MNARERLCITLNHQEPDRIPLDLGSTQVTGIHKAAYIQLREALGLPTVKITESDTIQQLALPDEDIIQKLGVDIRGLFPLNSHNWNVIEEDAGNYWAYHDEWGITHHRPKDNGLYFSIVSEPINKTMVTVQDIKNHPWPNMADPQRIAGLHEQAEKYRTEGYAVVIKSPFAGLFEMSQRIIGMQNCLMMMATDKAVMQALFTKMLQLKLDFWEMALPQLADVVDVVMEADDYGTQVSQLISPKMFREQLKPHWATLFGRMAELAPDAKRFFHSCGNVRPILPDFIEMGVQILNPIHIRANGMNPVEIKRDFGDALTFWGGAVDTQGVLPNGTPAEVKDDVRRNIEALASGGGYVFNTVHNIQADVPAENLIAMYQALQEYGTY